MRLCIQSLSNSMFCCSNFITFDDTGIVTILSNQTPGDFISHGIDIRLNTSTNIIKDVNSLAVYDVE